MQLVFALLNYYSIVHTNVNLNWFRDEIIKVGTVLLGNLRTKNEGTGPINTVSIAIV